MTDAACLPESMDKSTVALKPYNPNACCGCDCFAFGLNPAEQCWGDVSVAGEIDLGDDYVWIHECEGHAGCAEDGEKFKAQTPAG